MAFSVVGTATCLLIVFLCEFQCNGDSTQLIYDESKDTLKEMKESADYSKERNELLAKYTGDRAEECKTQLLGKAWDTDLQKKITKATSKIQYIDKLMHEDVLKCEGNKACEDAAKARGLNDLNVLKENNGIPKHTKKIIDAQRKFMDTCVNN